MTSSGGANPALRVLPTRKRQEFRAGEGLVGDLAERGQVGVMERDLAFRAGRGADGQRPAAAVDQVARPVGDLHDQVPTPDLAMAVLIDGLFVPPERERDEAVGRLRGGELRPALEDRL